jgi:hypothetical protein
LTPIRALGSVLGLVTGGWTLYVVFFGESTLPRGTSLSSASDIFMAVGAALVVVSLVSFSGIRASFLVGAVLSGAVLVMTVSNWSDFPASDSGVALAVSAITIVLDVVASRPARGLSEKDSPLNLPVFG